MEKKKPYIGFWKKKKKLHGLVHAKIQAVDENKLTQEERKL